MAGSGVIAHGKTVGGVYTPLLVSSTGALQTTDSGLAVVSAVGDTETPPSSSRMGVYQYVWDPVGSFMARVRAIGSGSGSGLYAGYFPGVSVLGFDGATMNAIRVPTVFKDISATAITAGTAATVWTPAGGKKFRLMGWSLSSSAAASIIFRYGATPTTMFRTELLAAAGITQTPPGFSNGSMPGANNEVLKLDVTVTSTVSGFVFGTEE